MLHHNINRFKEICKNSSQKTCFVVDVDFVEFFLETYFTEVKTPEIVTFKKKLS